MKSYLKSYLMTTKISVEPTRYWRGGLSIGLVWKPQDLKRSLLAVGTLDNLFACTSFCIRPA